MSRYDDGDWPAYVPVAERRRKAEREVARLRKKGHPVAPVRIEGRAIAVTAWGKAWCDNLESYRDYESRLPRGRTYVRNGSVIDLRVGRCEVEALVSGSSIYRVTVGIAAMPAAQWRSICADCAGRIESLVELLQGRLSKGVMERMCRQGSGLFPKPPEIRFSCTCEDHASMCKHVATALYGVGARLDEKPELLFRLRAVNEGDLLADLDSVMPASKPAGGRVLAAEDVSALFGLDLAGSDVAGGGDDGGASRSLPTRDQPTTVSRPKPKAARPARAPSAAQRSRSSMAPTGPGASTKMPVAPKKRVAAQLDGSDGLGKKAAEKLVADVVARIGKHLVMGVDVRLAGLGTPMVSARDARTPRDITAGSGVRTPGREKPVLRPAKKTRDAV